MRLVLDFGNTFRKAAVYTGDQLLEVVRTRELSRETILSLKQRYGITEAILSSVASHGEEFEYFLRDNFNSIILSHKTPLPINLDYETPETLGKDRIAAVAAAYFLTPGRNFLVIDGGTCITYDIIDSSGTYRGGSISPGMTLRLQSLHTLTARLPLVEFERRNDVEKTGKTTNASILSGVVWGVLNEVDGWITHYNSTYDDLKTLVTGGMTYFFESKLKSEIFAHPSLVLFGLNKILEYNVSRKA